MESLIHNVGPVLELVGVGFEILGAAIICIGTLLAFIRYGRFAGKPPDEAEAKIGFNPYRRLKTDIGRSLLLGLEVFVAADIIRTVALDLTFERLGSLGLLVLIRTFVSWTLVLEIEGRWPWQAAESRNG
ncbi:MAG: DUF1622 domain-containing protein [Chloroflexota bacterium]